MKKRYEIDESNQVVIRGINQDAKEEKLVVDGEFSVDGDNALVFSPKGLAGWKKEIDLPDKIKFVGNWSINPNHDLELTLSETEDQYEGDILSLKGEILSVEANALVFEVTSKEKSGIGIMRLLKLGGRWQADERNRLSFLVKKKEREENVITFEGAWEVDETHQIIYRYEKTDLKTKEKLERTLSFKGFWEISSSDRIAYILDLKEESYFSFKVQLESPNLMGKEEVIKYRVGIGVEGREIPFTQTISLFGTWKFGRKGGISFQIDYGEDRVKAIVFGANVYLTKKDEVVFELKNRKGEDLGITVSFNRKFLKSKAEGFLRFKRLEGESKVDTGIRIPW